MYTWHKVIPNLIFLGKNMFYSAILFLALAFFGIILVNPGSMAEKCSDIDHSLITNINFLVTHRNASWVLKFGLVKTAVNPSNFATQLATHKQEVALSGRDLVLTLDMFAYTLSEPTGHRHGFSCFKQNTSLKVPKGRLQFWQTNQSDLEWIFCNLESGFQSFTAFQIPRAGFRIPKTRILESTSKHILDSGTWITLHGAS